MQTYTYEPKKYIYKWVYGSNSLGPICIQKFASFPFFFFFFFLWHFFSLLTSVKWYARRDPTHVTPKVNLYMHTMF